MSAQALPRTVQDETHALWLARVLAVVAGVFVLLPLLPAGTGASFREALPILFSSALVAQTCVLWIGQIRGPGTRLSFDRQHGRILATRNGMLGRRILTVAYNEVGQVGIVRRETDTQAWYDLTLHVAGRRRPLVFGRCDGLAEAERRRERLLAELRRA